MASQSPRLQRVCKKDHFVNPHQLYAGQNSVGVAPAADDEHRVRRDALQPLRHLAVEAPGLSQLEGHEPGSASQEAGLAVDQPELAALGLEVAAGDVAVARERRKDAIWKENDTEWQSCSRLNEGLPVL